MFESPEKPQMLESLKSYPPDLLLRAALSHSLPPELQKAITDFLNKGSRPETPKKETGINAAAQEIKIAIDPKWAELIEAYNKVSLNPDSPDSDEYEQRASKFSPQRFGVLNAEERAREPGRIPLKLGTLDRGDFLIFQASPTDTKCIALPRTGRGLNRSRLEAGGWSDLFDCKNIDPYFSQKSYYDKFKVLKPAMIQVSGGNVYIIEKGILEYTE